MTHPIQTILHIIVLLIGSFFLYAGLFLYESEVGSIQNRLESMWVQLEDYAALPQRTRFMRFVSHLTKAGYDRLFGEKLFSRRAFSVSICYSVASASLLGIALLEIPAVAAILVPEIRSLTGLATHRDMLEVLSIAAILYAALGTYPAFVEPSEVKDWLKWVNKLALFPVLGLSLITPEVFKQPAVFLELASEPWRYAVLLLLVGSFVCDVLFIAVTRRTLEWCSETANFGRIAALLLTNLFLGVLLVFGPLGLPGRMKYLGTLNIIDMVAASVFVFIACLMLLHVVLRLILPRLLYALIVGRIGRQRTLYVMFGIALIVLGSNPLMRTIQSFLTKLLTP